MSRKKTLQKSDCDHISRVKEWGFDDTHNFRATLWDCVTCGIESSTPFIDNKFVQIDHSNCTYDPCFGCKAKGLQLNTGDANSQKNMSNKKFNKELDAYKEARKQGIQPNGTSMTKIDAALKASETLGKAYDGNTMISAEKITPDVAKVMKEIS